MTTEEEWEFGRKKWLWLHLNTCGLSDYYTSFNKDGRVFYIWFQSGHIYNVGVKNTGQNAWCTYKNDRPKVIMYNEQQWIMKNKFLYCHRELYGVTLHGNCTYYKEDGTVTRIDLYYNGLLIHKRRYEV